MNSRRAGLWSGSLAAGLAVLAASACQARPVGYEAAQAVAPGVWLIPGQVGPDRQPDGNTTVIEGPEGLIVIDTGRHADHRVKIEALIASTGRPLAAIVNTHWHFDHIIGNAGLTAAHPQARVHASGALEGAIGSFLEPGAVQARAYLEAEKPPEPLAGSIRADLEALAAIEALRPDVVITESGLTTLGGRQLEVRLARHAATEGDVWMFDAESDTAVVGDLVTLPAPFLDTACPEGWRTALDQVAAAPFERLVPGHGRVLDRAGFETYRTAFGALIDCARTEQPAQACAGAWAEAVGPLLAEGEGGVRIARGMTAGYVTRVLRSDEARGEVLLSGLISKAGVCGGPGSRFACPG